MVLKREELERTINEVLAPKHCATKEEGEDRMVMQGGEVDNNVEKRKMKWKGRAELDAWWQKNCSFQ
ncbi:unnamed protein product [Amaranthus hypochondriacus]